MTGPADESAIPILLVPVAEPAAPAPAGQQNLFGDLPAAPPEPPRVPRRSAAQVRADALAELQRRAPALVERVLADHEQLLAERLRALLQAELAQILRESADP